MKTRLLIIIIGLSIAAIFGVLYTANVIQNIEDQKAQEEWREIREKTLSEIKKNKTDSGWIADEDYCGDLCDQKELYALGCNPQLLAYIYKFTNLLDEEFDGKYYRNLVGLPDGITEEEYDNCAGILFEKRINSEKKDSESIFEPGPEDGFTRQKFLQEHISMQMNDQVMLKQN